MILNTLKMLTEAASYARFAEAAVRVAKHQSVTPTPVGAVDAESRSSGSSVEIKVVSNRHLRTAGARCKDSLDK